MRRPSAPHTCLPGMKPRKEGCETPPRAGRSRSRESFNFYTSLLNPSREDSSDAPMSKRYESWMAPSLGETCMLTMWLWRIIQRCRRRLMTTGSKEAVLDKYVNTPMWLDVLKEWGVGMHWWCWMKWPEGRMGGGVDEWRGEDGKENECNWSCSLRWIRDEGRRGGGTISVTLSHKL